MSSFRMDGDKNNWEMTEGKSQTLGEFLGIEMTYVDGGKGFKMTQDDLINNILNTCSMEYFKLRPTPNDLVAPIRNDSLVKESNIQDEWKYESLIGTLMYVTRDYSP